MLDAGYPAALVELVKSFLRRRKIRAKVDGAKSTPRELEAGVPQGAVLSPHLYAIFTCDLPRSADTIRCLYADDTALLARSCRARTAARYLQRALSDLEAWCNRWKVAINAEKSNAVLFSRRYAEQPDAPLVFDGEAIEWTDSAKYLGVLLDKRLRWKLHVDAARAKATFTRGKLRPLLCSDSRLSLRNKLLLVKTVVQPQLTYASTAWASAAPTHLKRLQAVENIALRIAAQAPWFVRNVDIRRDLKWKTATEAIKAKAKKLFAAAETHPNPLVRAAVDYLPDPASPVRRPRLLLLDAEEGA